MLANVWSVVLLQGAVHKVSIIVRISFLESCNLCRLLRKSPRYDMASIQLTEKKNDPEQVPRFLFWAP